MSVKLGNTSINSLGVINKGYLGTIEIFGNVFTSLWQTTTPNETITLPTPTNYKVDWGDGTLTTNANSHEYATANQYTIKISGDITDFAFNNGGDKDKILEISKLNKLKIIESAFYGALNLDITATDLPIIQNGFNVFRGNSSLIYNSSIENYDFSNITDLTNFFFGCSNFNQNINGWFIDNKNNLSGMFRGCVNYNQPLNGWNTSNVSSMNNLFYGCTNFDQNIDIWDVENVVTFNQTFFNCKNYNQPLNSWDTLSCVDVSLMFYNCENFNQPLNNWITTSFVTASFLFFGCTDFNQNINDWDTQNINTLYRSFRGASSYNQPMNNWETSKVTDMSEMFYGAISFNQDISNWSFVAVVNMSNFFFGKGAEYDVNYMDNLYIKLDQDLIFANMVNINLVFGSINYTAAGAAARANLVSKGFIITSGIQV